MEFLKIPKLFASTFYAVPDYQRDYEWTNAQNTTLLDDVFALFDSSEGNHFFGAIVTIPYEKNNGCNKSIDFDEYDITDEKNIKHVVDGQQRLTSFSILAKAICDKIEELFSEDKSFVKNQSRKLEQIYLSNYFKGDSPAPYLILNDNTGACYNNEILKVTDQTYYKNFKGAKRILEAYKFFKNEISLKYNELYGDDLSLQKKFYGDLVETLLNKVTIVEISCDKSADAFQVFDSLNGKGLDSSKNRNQIWDNFAQKVGEDYLAGFFVSKFFYNKNKRISKNKLPEIFKEMFKEPALENFDEFNKLLCEQGEIYGKLRTYSTDNNKLNSALQDLKNLKMEQIYVMLFAAILNYGIDIVSKNEFVNFTKILTKLVVRMQVCEKNMNRLDSHFSDWIGKMKSPNTSIIEISNVIENETKIIVPDENFKQSFADFAPSDNKISEYYLIQLEEFLRRTENSDRNPVGKIGLSVEHIIPKAYSFTDWYGNNEVPADIVDNFKSGVVEHIGNKALLYGDDNTSAKNNNYEKKMKVYRQGKKDQTQGSPYDTFLLIKKLVSDFPQKFTHEQVKERAKKLADMAVQIW